VLHGNKIDDTKIKDVKIMAKKFLYAALAGVSLLFAGCNEDLVGDYVQPTEKHFGEEIMFGGSASYDVNGNGGTRTIYGGYDKDNEKEPVYWVPTDEVRLYCPEAAVKTADYTVNGITSNQQTTVGLTKKGEVGLQWGNPGSQHTFYGTYPIPADASLQAGVSVTGTIPAVQDVMSPTSSDGNITFLPNMEYAYMVAKTVVASPNAIGDNVFLQFTPIATAVEIELRNDANIESFDIREVHLSSETDDLSGSFTANLDNMTLSQQPGGSVSYGSGCPTDITYGDDAYKTVGVRLTQGTSTITLEPDMTLRFTIFMLPGTTSDDSIDDLRITLISSSGQKNGTLQNISVKKSKKNYMHKMPIGGKISYKQSEWLKYVEDDKVLNTLSIPGAGGAASGKATYGDDKWTTDQKYLEQELSITQLWDAGIRCFEFTVDKDDDATGGYIGDNIVYCNSKACGTTTLASAVGGVKSLLLEHPEEFAMVIITYQDNDGWGMNRDASVFQSQLDAFWREVSNGQNTNTASNHDDAWIEGTGTELYNPAMTVNEARGKLFCIARPTSEYEDNAPQVNGKESGHGLAHTSGTHIASVTYDNTKLDVKIGHEDILVIKGWGAMKDKFERRGYTTCHFHRGTGHEDYAELKTYLAPVETNWAGATTGGAGVETAKAEIGYVPGAPGRPFDVSSENTINTIPDNYITNLLANNQLTANFQYDVVKSDGNASYTAWVQEWARVSNSEDIISREGWDNWSTKQYFRWSNSLGEKKQRVKECLEKSIAAESSRLYINSLCGYYISSSDENSFYPNVLTELNGRASTALYGGRCYVLNALTGDSNIAGMSGDIATFASEINTYFKGLLDGMLDNYGRLAGSTGIVLMDRVANTGDGAEIPSIIIANNFAANQNATDPTTPTSVVADGDTPLSREGVNVVWGEWE